MTAQGEAGFDSKRTWGPQPNYPSILKSKPFCPGRLLVVAGPCSIESPERAEEAAVALKACGVGVMRGGVFRAGTYPPVNPGLRKELLNAWRRTCDRHGLLNVVEVISLLDLGYVAERADFLQVGARQMQNYGLLLEVARLRKPVLLKRNMGSTLDEFLGAAEYLARGRCSPILVERGSATHMNHVRWDLSVSTVAALKRITGATVLVDASHGTGRRDLVEPMTLAGIAAGADGFIVEVHPDPERSLSDADQALHIGGLPGLVAAAMRVREAVKGPGTTGGGRG